MPRNPNKRICQVPRCRSWAMRGHNQCRSHLDRELGPRAAGAPKRNLNALKSGANANPFSKEELRQFAFELAQEPERFPQHINRIVESIHSRSRGPVSTLLLLIHVFQQLLPLVSDNDFIAQLDAHLEYLPPAERSGPRALIWKFALPMSPLGRLKFMEAFEERFSNQ